MNYDNSDLFTFPSIYSDVVYKGDFSFSHKLAQTGKLPMTSPKYLRLILGVLQLQYGLPEVGLGRAASVLDDSIQYSGHQYYITGPSR
jgi:hypothetical protein